MGNFAVRPDNASNFANEYDALFGVITLLTVFFTVLVFAVVIFLAIRYRKGSNVDRSKPKHENLKLEIAWSVIPLFMALGVFAWGAKLFVDYRTPPANATEVFVMGKQWMWHIQHMNGVRENNLLTVPVNKPIKLTMVSQDVIHAFYVPEFRIQFMVVPGRYTQEWFTATKIGTYKLLCNMYCGTSHSEMVGQVRVLSQADYERFLTSGGKDLAPVKQSVEGMGKDLYDELACANCHTGQDTPRGPSLYGIAGKERKLASGRTAKADDEYLRNALINPSLHLTAGYDDLMPVYSDLSEEQIMWLVSYMKSLGGPPKRGATPIKSDGSELSVQGGDSKK